jgi:uncharacterized OsmC-like protein/alpha/beta superfamily hydrolase
MPTTKRVEFSGAHGHALAARLELPSGTPSALALFAHCFTCSKDYKAVVRISRELAADGVAVCRFDFTGLGESKGEFADTNFSSNLEDLYAAAEFLRREYEAPQLLIGHSLGGAAMLAAAASIPEARAVVTIAAPSDTEHLVSRLQTMAPELESEGEGTITLAGRPFRVRRQLLLDLESHNMEGYVGNLGRPLLIIHSPDDRTLGIDHAERLFEMASQPKTFLAVDGADHLLAERQQDWRFVASAISLWAQRYLRPGPGRAVSADDAVAAREVVVEGGAEGYVTEIRAGHHRLRADEPIAEGGTDLGPNPYSFLLTALGACMVITLRMYAERKGWPLEGSRIHLRHSRIHAADCEDCQSDQGRVDRIDVALELLGDLSDQQLRRLVEISAGCPVHRSLESEVSIKTVAV